MQFLIKSLVQTLEALSLAESRKLNSKLKTQLQHCPQAAAAWRELCELPPRAGKNAKKRLFLFSWRDSIPLDGGKSFGASFWKECRELVSEDCWAVSPEHLPSLHVAGFQIPTLLNLKTYKLGLFWQWMVSLSLRKGCYSWGGHFCQLLPGCCHHSGVTLWRRSVGVSRKASHYGGGGRMYVSHASPPQKVLWSHWSRTFFLLWGEDDKEGLLNYA